jgi:flagellin-like protein
LTRIRNVRTTTKFKRSVKAISPVIATLLMIAIAVVASLVVYAWVTGYMGNTTDKAGKAIQIQSTSRDGTFSVSARKS